jgi:hypothetical protein
MSAGPSESRLGASLQNHRVSTIYDPGTRLAFFLCYAPARGNRSEMVEHRGNRQGVSFGLDSGAHERSSCESNGQAACGRVPVSAVQIPGFLPSISGLHFDNSNFSNVPLLTIDVGVAKVPIGNASNGMCGGMAYTVRDYFETGGPPAPDDTNPSSGPLFDYLVRRLFDSFNLLQIPPGPAVYLHLMDPALPDHETWFSSAGLAPHGRAWVMIRQEWPRIRDDIDNNRLSPIGLIQVKTADPFQMGQNHQVLVYGYDLIGDDLTMNIYDPNHPGDDGVTISLNIGNPDHTTQVSRSHDTGTPIYCFFRTDYAFSSPPPVNQGPGLPGNEWVWMEDGTPAGATLAADLENWAWASFNPLPRSGRTMHTSRLVSGMHQHYFYNASQTMPVIAGDTLFAYAWLDPNHPPSQLMLQWNDGSWEHRAYWGADQIGWGVNGTQSRKPMGALPPLGQWVRLEVPASAVALEGRTVSGMAFTLFGGRAAWDRAGRIPPALRDMVVQVQPYPMPVQRPVRVLITATDAISGASVAATIKINGAVVGTAGVPFNFTFRPRTVHIGGLHGDVEVIFPTGTASAPTYRTSAIDFGF